jgi:hypothetical protein
LIVKLHGKLSAIFARADRFSFYDLSCTRPYQGIFSHQKPSLSQKRRPKRLELVHAEVFPPARDSVAIILAIIFLAKGFMINDLAQNRKLMLMVQHQ